MIGYIVKGCLTLVVFIMILFMILLAYVYYTKYKLHIGNEKNIELSLRSHYFPHVIQIHQRIKFPEEENWEYDSQVCFELSVKNNGATSRRFAMVESDSDQSNWIFVREYNSIKDCTDRFNRG